MKKKPVFIPLPQLDSKFPNYLYTRSEILKKAREVLKDSYVHEITLEDSNKISFKVYDIDFVDIMKMWTDLAYGIDDVSDMSFDGAGQGIWVIVFFNWAKLFPPRNSKYKQKTGRLKE
jgi:hypothetical protein